MTRLDEVRARKISEIKEGAYYRCFGNIEIADLLSRIAGLVSKNGNELENLILSYGQSLLIHDLDAHLEQSMMAPGVRLVEKKVIKESKQIEGHTIEPDFMIFQRVRNNQFCFIIELKDGHNFDTVSSRGEHQKLSNFLTINAGALHGYNSFCKIVGFNAQSREEIVEGFKRKFPPEQAMTGAEFCELLGIDYEEIRSLRAIDCDHNLELFVEEVSQIPAVRDRVLSRDKG